MYQMRWRTCHGMRSAILINSYIGIQAEIVPERGALLTSLKVHEKEYLYFNAENFCSSERPRCGMPVLFPCCGRSFEGSVRFAEKAYPMPIHGFAHTSSWEVRNCGADNHSAWITLELRDTPATKEMYPFSFSLSLVLRILEDQLCIKYECINRDEVPMPFDLGYHPYFVMSGLSSVEFLIPGQSDPLVLSDEAEVNHQISNPPSGIRLHDRVRHTMVAMHYTENFNSLVFWSIPFKGFVCMEPWQGVPNGLNCHPSKILIPGQSAQGTVRLIPGFQG